MPFDIVIGREKKAVEKYGKEGTIFLGRQYVKMGEVTSLSNPIYMDIASSHVVFIVGKRGSGKSYSLSVIAEGISDLPLSIKQNLSIILLDTMGVFWTMKYPNQAETEALREWNIEPKALPVTIYTPAGFYQRYKEKGIPTDFPFAIMPEDLDPEDWCLTFNLDVNSPAGVLLSRIVHQARDEAGSSSIAELISLVVQDKATDETTKNIVINQFHKVEDWGIFAKEGTPLQDLARAGQVTILDLSPYATLPSGWLIKALVVGLLAKRLFTERMIARKTEEFESIDTSMHYFLKEGKEKLEQPLIWLALDEAHELLPKEGRTAATDALITLLREGRQPGISMILASQQPGKIHTDVITQSDVVVAHRLTAKADIDALGELMQSYMRRGLEEEINMLPRTMGAALVFDDINERIFPMHVRPKFSWHGGESPSVLKVAMGNGFGRKKRILAI